MNGEEKPKRSRWKLLFIVPAVLFLVLMCALVLVFGIMFLTSVPQDSPSGFMFRTEADMQAIISALRGYHREYEIYPASGKVGLDAAIDRCVPALRPAERCVGPRVHLHESHRLRETGRSSVQRPGSRRLL